MYSSVDPKYVYSSPSLLSYIAGSSSWSVTATNCLLLSTIKLINNTLHSLCVTMDSYYVQNTGTQGEAAVSHHTHTHREQLS